jgi:hypothetical protein
VLRPLAAGQTLTPEAFDKLLDEISGAKHELADKLGTTAGRFYTPIYIRSSVAAVIGASRKDNYRMLMVSGRGTPPRLATKGDVTDGKTLEPDGKARK